MSKYFYLPQKQEGGNIISTDEIILGMYGILIKPEALGLLATQDQESFEE